MPDVWQVLVGLVAIMTLVLANGFFVAAEFSLVTVRKTRIDQLIAEGSATARVVRRALGDPDSYIAATQLGITMTSLGLGWIGEPALAVLLEPGLAALVGDRIAAATAHSIAFTIAFAIITALHIVLGELAPKTVALQHPERTSLIVARPTELFMRVFWPFISLLNGMGRTVVQAFGLRGPSGHSLVHSEEELKMLVTASQEAGVIEEDEEQMLHRVFGFADLTAGQVMVPRTEMVASQTMPLWSPCCRPSRERRTTAIRSIARTWTTSSACCTWPISSRCSPAAGRSTWPRSHARRTRCPKRCPQTPCSARCARATRRSRS